MIATPRGWPAGMVASKVVVSSDSGGVCAVFMMMLLN